MFSPGSQKVTAGCFSSCGLSLVWLSLNTFLPLHVAQHCFAKHRFSQSLDCWLAWMLSNSLAAVTSLVLPAPRGYCFTGLGGGTFNPNCQAVPMCLAVPHRPALWQPRSSQTSSPGCGRWGGEVGGNEASHYSSIFMSTSCSPPAESS